MLAICHSGLDLKSIQIETKFMTQKISESVSVRMIFDHRLGKARPEQILWHNKVYPVTQLGLRHIVRDGRKLFHVFSLVSNLTFLRLSLDTENLSWTLEEISDGISS